MSGTKSNRQAVISLTVTKGLNSNALMTDSGYEWLGAVPEHWDVIYSKWLFTERNTKAMANDDMLTASQKYGVISQKEFMRLENQKVVQVQKGHDILKHVEPNDFVISMRSFQGGIEFSPTRGSVSSAYVPLFPIGIICSGYFKYLFKSTQYIQALQSTTNLVRDGQALRYNNFIQVRLPLPPLQEQKEIAAYLDAQIARIDVLIEKSNQGTVLLNERLIALISAAVTGKIDVRNWQPSQSEIPMEASA
jgi:type I restriction enzyme S subunit